MKRLIILLICAFTALSCIGPRYATAEVPYQSENIDVREVLVQCYPDLLHYYDEGVLRVTSIRRSGQEIGLPNYIINYKFVKYYYNYVETSSLLKEKYPSLYEEYIAGRIRINHLYKYVDENGVIQHCVSYRWVHAPYYTYRVIYHPRTYYWRYHRPPMSRPHKVVAPPAPRHGAPHPKQGQHKPAPQHGSHSPASHGNHAPAQRRGGRR